MGHRLGYDGDLRRDRHLPTRHMHAVRLCLPSPSVEIKLLDVPEAGYFATNSSPQGEILVRGASVTRGYYKRDDFISDEIIFMKDGWLRTRVTSASGIKNPMKLGLRGNYIAA